MASKITVNDITPSLNQTSRMHWAARKRLKDKWSLLILEAYQKSYPNKPMGYPGGLSKRRVKIERYSKKQLDIDNFFGGIKETIIDNIKSRTYKKINGKVILVPRPGLIFDDDENYLTLRLKQVISNTERKTVITVYD